MNQESRLTQTLAARQEARADIERKKRDFYAYQSSAIGAAVVLMIDDFMPDVLVDAARVAAHFGLLALAHDVYQ